MRLKLDENITVVVQGQLQALGHDVDTVADEGLTGRPDQEVAEAARTSGRMVVTCDVGFGDLRAYPPGSHSGLVVLRLRDQQPGSVVLALQKLTENHDLDALAGCIVVVTETLIRIRWPE